MGTQHQPRRDDAQRVIDRQTRARRELMRRQQLENVRGNIAAINKLIEEGPAIPTLALNEIRSAHKLGWWAQLSTGLVAALERFIDGIKSVIR